MPMDVRVAFTSVGVNRAAGVLDWDLLSRGGRGDDDGQQQESSGLTAYGGGSAVCLFDPEVSVSASA